MLIPSLGYVLPVEKRSKISSCFQGLVGRTLVKLLVLPAVQRPIFRITYFSRIGSFEHAAKRSELDTKSCPGPRAAHSCVLAALAVESFVLALPDLNGTAGCYKMLQVFFLIYKYGESLHNHLYIILAYIRIYNYIYIYMGLHFFGECNFK